MTVADLERALHSKLDESGLADESIIEQLGFRLCTAAQFPRELAGPAAGGFVIPYYNPDRHVVKNFFRYRYLEQPEHKGFAALVERRELRYTQPSEQSPLVYWSPLINWRPILADIHRDLVLTEGENKANCACYRDIAALALGGVWNFRSTHNGSLLIDGLQQLPWRGRRVYIVYDSDALLNPSVMAAEDSLGAQLLQQGARVFIARLPNIYNDGRKTGLDDFLVARDAKTFKEEVIARAAELDSCRELFAIDQDWLVCRKGGYVIHRTTGERISHGIWTCVTVADRKWIKRIKDENGNIVKIKEVEAGPAYLKWPARSSVWEETYAPGRPRLIGDTYNRWSSWGCEPKEDFTREDIQPFLELTDFLFSSVNKAVRHKLMQWLAYPLQHPGTKLKWAPLLWGEHGTGKTFLGYIMKDIYGKNFAEIESRHLDDDFNDYAEDKQFILGDEIHRASAIKSNITREQVRINIKNIRAFYQPDCINWMFTSNEADALHFDDTERRYCVVEVPSQPHPPLADGRNFYTQYLDPWRHRLHGARAVFAYLLQYDLTSFNPNDPAPETPAKREMSELAVRDDLHLFARRLRLSPDEVLRDPSNRELVLPYSLFTLDQLLRIVDPLGSNRNLSAALWKVLRKEKFRKAYAPNDSNNTTVNVPGVGYLNLWLVRPLPGFPSPTHDKVVKQYLKERKPIPQRKEKF